MYSKLPGLSVLIITYNEIGYIERCLDSISFASEIIVVDSYSTDGTYEYLRAHPRVKVLQNPFENFTAQKNFALRQASNDWVLFVDADEVVPSNLREEILNTLANSNPEVDAYWFYRKFMFGNRPLRFSGWQTDKNIRLFRKSRARYSEKRLVHEHLELKGKTACLKEKLDHYCYKNYPSYKHKMLLYGQLKAKEAFQNNKRFSYFKLLFKPFWRFTYNYVFRLGFLDGLRGVIICYLGALEDFERYKRLQLTEKAHKAAPFYSTALPELQSDYKVASLRQWQESA
jgi:glycosyltransferase involved in cell wall biosynthesis